MKDHLVVGNTGLYYVCYHLSHLGWNVMPTSRNARGIDIVAYNKEAIRYIGIQVKSLSKRTAVPLGTSLDSIMGDYWVIINQLATDDPQSYILTPEEVKSLSSRNEKEDRISYWLEPSDYDVEQFKEAWGRIGNG